MDYRKSITFHDEDGVTVLCDFDIVLNRSMGVNALRSYPDLIDIMFNNYDIDDKEFYEDIANDVKENDGKNRAKEIAKMFKSGKAEMLFAFNDYFPPMIEELFPAMLDKGAIRVGTKEEILSIVNECLIPDNDFMESMTDFFMDACTRRGNATPKKKVKFSMN